MALNVWTQRSGYSLGSYPEREIFNVVLPVTSDAGVTYSVISGKLPAGLRIQGNHIVGTPYEVSRTTSYTFCIRASLDGNISDRTLTLEITSANGPEFVTPEGGLPVGPSQQLFTLDSSYIDFQIEVTDLNLSTTQHLSFFISRDDGELPPGLVLTKDGRIVGFVQPALSIKPEDGSGTYDESIYDAVAYDFAFRPSNGYDSYIYDNVFYDFNTPTTPPKKLNRNYEFFVSVSDGDVTIKRKFDIFVVGDDYFRADNTFLSGLFTADVTYLRKPIWLTPSYLGTYRANNYITIPLETYDTENIINNLEALNPDNTASALPPGMLFDVNTSEIYGAVPYQPAITTTYKFTITSTRFSDKLETAVSSRTFTINIIGEIDSVINWDTAADLGKINANFISTLSVKATSTISDSTILYTLVDGKLPPGLTLDLDGEIVGKVNQFGNFTEGSFLNYLDAEYATTGGYTVVVDGGNAYSVNLTPLDGNPIAGSTTPGLTRFYDLVNGQAVFTTFDGGSTTVDRVFTFTVQARDQFGISATTRKFTITVLTPNTILYSNIRVKPFLKNTVDAWAKDSISQRDRFKEFIYDTNIFTPSSIYRTNDPNFGLHTDLSMIIYAGIETTQAAAYVGAIGLNHKKKRFQFGSIKTSTAYVPGTKKAVYEVIYLEMIDPLEPNGKRLPSSFKTSKIKNNTITVDEDTSFWSNTIDTMRIDAPEAHRPDPIITVDGQGYFASNPNPDTYFPNSVTNWQDRINAIGVSERNYLPLWMRSIQPGTKEELGFKLAVPLCYCKVGTSADILLNIKHSGFDFSLIDYTVDRYIIDSVEGSSADKYLVFKNDRITL